MGYTTEFKGSFKLTPALNAEQKEVLNRIYDSEGEEGEPSSYCQWEINEAGDELEWDGGEKFYNYEEWLHYINNHLLKPWGIVMDGIVKWQGEEMDDRGKIEVKEGVINFITLD